VLQIDVVDMSEKNLNDMLRAAFASYQNNKTPIQSCEAHPASPPAKKLKESQNNEFTVKQFLRLFSQSVEPVSATTFSIIMESVQITTGDCELDAPTSKSVSPYLEHLINSIGHPEVLKVISEQFVRNVLIQNPQEF